MQLYISMEGEPKEIADLVLFVQDRLCNVSADEIDRELGKRVDEAIGGINRSKLE